MRGVAVNPDIIKTLLERNWVRVIGTRDVPGRPEVLGTTQEFLDYFGLQRLEQLPPLAELKALTELNVQLELPGAAPVAAALPAPAAAAAAAAETTDVAPATDATATEVIGGDDSDAEPEAPDERGEDHEPGAELADGPEAQNLVAAAGRTDPHEE